jgi:Domain of unknown function (DUF1929)
MEQKLIEMNERAAVLDFCTRWTLRLVAATVLVACGGGGGSDSSSGGGDKDPLVEDLPPTPTVEDEPEDRPVDEAAGAEPPFAIGDTAQVQGAFGPAFGWPIIPIHMVMLPDGRVLSYGSDQAGIQGGLLRYAVWDPALGQEATSFQVLDNTTGTDIFCASQFVQPRDGKVMVIGGDRSINALRNYAVADVNVFDGATNTLTKQAQPMTYRRWYATAVTMGNGEQVVLGGRDDREQAATETFAGTLATYATTPEVFNPDTGWRTLPGAFSDAAFGAAGENFWYPKAWLAPNGKVVSISHAGSLFEIDPAGSGTITAFASKMLYSNANAPSVMYAPGKIMSMRHDNYVQLLDLNGEVPVISDAAPASTRRRWGFATVLPDGQVWANGGSKLDMLEVDAVLPSELWNPTTNTWTITASATRSRLYHSTSILLPDATVLTGGGGAPGPVANLNAEIYYPPYLFSKDGSKTFAVRPVISAVAAPSVGWASALTVDVQSTTPISRVTWVRTGAATHSFNNEQRFMELPFTQTGTQLQVTTPASVTQAPPGYYMLFVFDAAGVPSVARILRMAAS